MLHLLELSSISKNYMLDLVQVCLFINFYISKILSLLYYISFPPFLLQRDVIADANIFQGAIFHEDNVEDTNGIGSSESAEFSSQKSNGENFSKLVEPMPKQTTPSLKPAAHRVQTKS